MKVWDPDTGLHYGIEVWASDTELDGRFNVLAPGWTSGHEGLGPRYRLKPQMEIWGPDGGLATGIEVGAKLEGWALE